MKHNIARENDIESLINEYGLNIKDLLSDGETKINVKQELLKKPFIFFNKYGDVKNYILEEFDKIS